MTEDKIELIKEKVLDKTSNSFREIVLSGTKDSGLKVDENLIDMVFSNACNDAIDNIAELILWTN